MVTILILSSFELPGLRASSSGQLTPNLNGEGRFLRGGLEEEMLNLEVGIKISSYHIISTSVQIMMLNLEEDAVAQHGHLVEEKEHSHGYEDRFIALSRN